MKTILRFFILIGVTTMFAACENEEKEPIILPTQPKPVLKTGVGPTGNELRSVNLGGWFVLEGWMTPSLFEDNNVVGSDETDFVTQVDNAKEQLEEHWSTFITQEDMNFIAENGITNVRIPIPWWLFGEGAKASDYIDFDALPTSTQEERDHKAYLMTAKEYIPSVTYIDNAMDMAHNAGLTVMLDLHTAPGGQNGFDNGGLTGVTHFGRGTSIEKTLEILERIAKRYKDHPALHSIEVLNEPAHWVLDKNNGNVEDKGMNRLQAFSLDAYNVIRKHVSDDVYVIFHDGFWAEGWIQKGNDGNGSDFFVENDLKNVVLDLHRYQVFSQEDQERSLDEHLRIAEYGRAQEIEKMQKHVNILIGEWSLGLPGKNSIASSERRYARAQLVGMKNAWGWSFWNYKIEHDTGWNFKSVLERQIMETEMWVEEE